MKLISMLLISALALVSCSSPKERHEERQAEAKEDYQEELKESQEQYEEEDLDSRRDEAKDMVDDSDDVKVDEDAGKIQVDD